MEEVASIRGPFYRFLRGQSAVYPMVLRRLEEGSNCALWMCYIFPRLRGLARSRKAFVYGIVDSGHGRAYLAHPILGPRLIRCFEVLLSHKSKSAEELLGKSGACHLWECATLFAMVSEEGSVFHRALDRFFRGEMDPWTVGFCKGRILDMTYRKFLVAVG